MKRNFLLSLAIFLGLSTLSQGAVAASIQIEKQDDYLPELTINTFRVPVAHLDNVEALENLVAGVFANSDHAGDPAILLNIIKENLVIKARIPAGVRPLNAATLALINAALQAGRSVPIEVRVKTGSMIRAGAGHQANFPRPLRA